MKAWMWLGVALVALFGGCTHAPRSASPEADARWASGEASGGGLDEGTRTKGNTVTARIRVLIARGEFLEARALIAEATASGLLATPAQLKEAAKLIKEQTRLMEKL